MSRPKIPEKPGLPSHSSEEMQRHLPSFTVRKDKVFYACHVRHGFYPCNVKNTRPLVELQKNVLNEAKKEFKRKYKTLTLTSKGLEFRRLTNVIVRGSTYDRMLPKDMVEEIRRDALKNLVLCPGCQKWVCKINRWNNTKGLCITCVSQGREAKRERREELGVTKTKNFCPYCGAKITDPAQTRCSECEALLLF